MITVKSNMGIVSEKLSRAIMALASPDGLLRTVATSMAPVIRDRIHVKGQAADGSNISEKGYSNEYLKLRQKKYNRTSEPLVILSLTRQQENDFGVQISSEGKYGLGYNNPINAAKAEWEEARYGKKIFALTPQELQQVNDISQQYVTEQFSALS